MSKCSIKSTCIWIKCLMWLQFFGERKTRFAHAIAANKRTDSHNFKTYIKFAYTYFLSHWYLKLDRGKSTWISRRWKWSLLSLWSLIVFVENIVVVVTFQRLLGSLLNLTFIFTQIKLHRWSVSLSSVLDAVYGLKQFSVYEGSCRNYSPESFGLF